MHVIDTDSLDLLTSNLSEDSKLLFNNELKHGRAPAGARRYSEELKLFAVTLHFYSAQAYDFLRKFLTLPDVSTIRRWSSSIGCEPGFLLDALDHIAKKKEANRQMADICIMLTAWLLKRKLYLTAKLENIVDVWILAPFCADHLQQL